MTIPTMSKMVKVYVEAAAVERLKRGTPGEATVHNTLSGVRVFRRWLNERRVALGYPAVGFDEDFPLVSIVKPPLVRKYLAELLRRKVKPVTALSYVNQLRQLFARWVRPYYDDLGWKVPEFPSFVASRIGARYVRPSPELLQKVKDWYRALSEADEGTPFQARRSEVKGDQLWFAATMMLEFAMRNSDILRLRRENFIEMGGRVFLNYTPHKTANSSGRMVKWPIHPLLWQRLKADMPELSDEVFEALNRQMRQLGFSGTKGAYELRKICIDHVYQKYGAEMAVSISGDDIKTITRYYADPAQPNIGAVRIVDLL